MAVFTALSALCLGTVRLDVKLDKQHKEHCIEHAVVHKGPNAFACLPCRLAGRRLQPQRGYQ